MDVNAVIAINSETGRTETVQSTQVVQDATARAGEGDTAEPVDRENDTPQEER